MKFLEVEFYWLQCYADTRGTGSFNCLGWWAGWNFRSNQFLRSWDCCGTLEKRDEFSEIFWQKPPRFNVNQIFDGNLKRGSAIQEDLPHMNQCETISRMRKIRHKYYCGTWSVLMGDGMGRKCKDGTNSRAKLDGKYLSWSGGAKWLRARLVSSGWFGVLFDRGQISKAQMKC